jgi:hypothetical protein
MWQQIAELGMKLAESWPIMRGAVGLWLWVRATCRVVIGVSARYLC